MNTKRHRAGAALALLLLAGWTSGCGNHRSLIAPALSGAADPPKLEVKAMRVAGVVPGMNRWRVTWRVTSGTADHFVVSRAPGSAPAIDASWTVTKETVAYVDAPARNTALSPDRDSRAPAVNFLVRAVDVQGRLSPLGGISVVNDNLAPNVQIISPPPTDRSRTYMPPSFEIRWEGEDPDGVGTTEPALYKWTLLTQNSPVPFHVALADPDSVRRYWEPRGYADWDSTGAENYPDPSIKFNNLVLGQDYLFVVVARDGQGAWTQIMNLNTNMLNMRIVTPYGSGPTIAFFNEFFYYQYPAPGYSTDPQYQIPIEVPANEPITLNWIAFPIPGAYIHSYRWALDIADVFDETPRTGPNDLAHWSAWTTETSATVGPFGGGETHIFYLDARDSNGLRSLGMVRITSVQATFEKPLLIVDDTRFLPDQKSAGSPCMNAPVGRWPTAAELDTFLYARGGVPWRCYPAGTMSTPGLFAGYEFDTVGTRGGNGTVPLALLSQYQHVVWLTDLAGATNVNVPTHPTSPMTALRYMSEPGRSNSLAAYASGGGRIWVAGGGITYATVHPYNRLQNDVSQPAPGTTYSNLLNELVPGRFPYDQGGWQSEAKVTLAVAQITRQLGRFGPGSAYGTLPTGMRPRTSLTDPYPPGRTVTPSNFWYSNFEIEYLSQPNNPQSELDSLYAASGATLVPPASNPLNVCMTIYRPPTVGVPRVYTGFSIWSFQRADSKGLVDWVLQQEWGMTPSAPAAKRPTLSAWRPGPR